MGVYIYIISVAEGYRVLKEWGVLSGCGFVYFILEKSDMLIMSKWYRAFLIDRKCRFKFLVAMVSLCKWAFDWGIEKAKIVEIKGCGA